MSSMRRGHGDAHGGGNREQTGSEPTTRAVWILIGTIAAAKTTTLLVIVWASGSSETLALVAATLPPWILVGGALIAGPVLFRLRLRRVRARREGLRRSEWMLPPKPVTPAWPLGPFRPKPGKEPVAQPR